MSIVSSSFSVGHAQADGRRYVREEHVDHLGAVHAREYGPAPEGTNYAALRDAYAVMLAAALADGEFDDRLGFVRPLVLQHQTAAQFAARLRERYRSGEREGLARIAWWIVEQINAGNITDAQVRTAFGFTTIQYTTFKSTKLVPAHDAWQAVLDARGE